MDKLEPYDKRADYSYCLGIYPCHALLDSRPETVLRLLLHPDGLENEGVIKLRRLCAERGVREEMADRVLRRESKKDNCYAGLVFEKFDSLWASFAIHFAFNGSSNLVMMLPEDTATMISAAAVSAGLFILCLAFLFLTKTQNNQGGLENEAL